MDVRIQSIHFTADKNLEEFVSKKIEKLETFFDQIINTEVFLKLENDGSSIQNKIAEVKVHVPGQTLFATETSKQFEESVDLATEQMRRQIKKYKEKLKK